MRSLAFSFTFALTLAAGAPLAHAGLVAPEDWRKQSFEFPLPFAPTLPFAGREEVRFAPAWARFAQSDGFSYVVLWDLERSTLEAAGLERALAVYFDGLMHTAGAARRLDAMVPASQVVLHPLAAPAGWSEGFAGTVHTWNAFGAAEPLVLNVEIAHRPCGDARMQVFYAFSKAARTHSAWDALRRVRAATTCSG